MRVSTNLLEMTKLSPSRLRWLSFTIVFFMLIYIATLLFVVNEDYVLKVVKQIPLTLFFWVLLLSILSYLLRFSRWYYFLSPLEPSIYLQKHLLIYFSGFTLTTTPGKAGETIRSLFLAPLGIRYHQSLAAFFSERLLDVVAVLTLSIFLFAWAFPEYQQWVLLSAVFIMILFLLVRSRLIQILMEKFLRHKSKVLLIAFQGQVSKFLSNRSLLIALPLSLIAWTAQGYGLYLIVEAFGFDVSPLLIIGIYNISILAGAISFMPGGIGATEAAISVLLISIGMDASLAVVASIVCRGMTLWVAIGIGILAILTLNHTKYSQNVT